MRKTLALLFALFGTTSALLAQSTNLPPDTLPAPLTLNDPFDPEKLVEVPYELTAVTRKYEKECIPLLEAGKYDKLDELADGLLKSKKELSSGFWEFDTFILSLAVLEKKAAVELWEQRLKHLQAWAAKKPDSIAVNACLANFWIDYAWKARGSGYAQTVGDDSFNLMRERIIKASEVLVKNQRFESQCPRFYALNQAVALVANTPRKQYDSLCTRAVATHPTYMGYHFRRVWHLQPRWHGESEREWLDYATKEADRLGGEEGDLFYARVACYMFDQHVFKGFLRDSGVSWPRLKQGLEVCIKRFPDSLWAKTRLCYFSAQNAEKQRTKQLFLEIGYLVDEEVWDKERFLKDRELMFRRIFHPQPAKKPPTTTSSPP